MGGSSEHDPDPSAETLKNAWDGIVGRYAGEGDLPPLMVPPPVQRVPLPFSTLNTRVLPGQTCKVHSEPRCLFKPERLFVSGVDPESTRTNAEVLADWRIDDMKIGGVSVMPRPLLATEFSNELARTFEAEAWLHALPASEEPIDLIVTYLGDRPDGRPFIGALMGIAPMDIAPMPPQ
jgi:hypothetical protein